MKRALVIAAAPEEEIGYIRRLYEQWQPDLVLCADGGLQKANRLQIPCDVLMGDMDSGGGEGAREVVRFPAEKDYTDSQSCLREALARGCGQVVLAGATGGRLDHLLCNLHLLEWVEGQGAHGYVVDGGNVAQILRPGVVQVPAQFRYFSLIPLDPVLAGVDIRGAKYPLQNATVRRDDSLCVSNEALGQAVEIRIAHGQAFLIFSK
ncbi:MAG TPA: thiamine diphosphokinase [Firmicutes bacterium]|nr:thiamine diphosphokinase [Bacillota bacterium]